jgi:penicillin-binding protein 1C
MIWILPWKKLTGIVLGMLVLLGFGLLFATVISMPEPPVLPTAGTGKIVKQTFLDRHGRRLNITLQNQWNLTHQISLHDVPEFLVKAFIMAEDKRFFSHHGVDWLARLNALQQNIFAGRAVRGASTITEQVVRMIQPRPRTLWNRWLEGFSAMHLERAHTKLEILEFYLNQVPYKANRRGIVEAAEYYFDRTVSTLSPKEILALAVLVRSPKWLDPRDHSENLERAIHRLATGLPPDSMPFLGRHLKQKICVRHPRLDLNPRHFIAYVQDQMTAGGSGTAPDGNHHLVHTSLSRDLQAECQNLMDQHLSRLARRNVRNGALLVVDHRTGEILAWVVGNADNENVPSSRINAVLARRQPGSALKPFIYALALEKGWTAGTLINDAPLEEGVGYGMHQYHNYSRSFYGPISLREALGNSLNIPAVKALQYVGGENFLSFLNTAGITSLSEHPNHYGDGIALGNGEVSLLEMVQAYTVLARGGLYKPLSWQAVRDADSGSLRVMSEETADLVSDILSDPTAREKEFGWGSILNLPYQTAVKTGTSSGYHDAWAFGYNDAFTVGVWMGNLDYAEMNKVSGSTGPAIVLRAVFQELNRNREPGPLFLSPNLVKKRICRNDESGMPAHNNCRDEWFAPGTGPDTAIFEEPAAPVRFRKPSPGLLLAMDPRIPDESEFFEFSLSCPQEIADKIHHVTWIVNGKSIGFSQKTAFLWPVTKGAYTAEAVIHLTGESTPIRAQAVVFQVQ